MTGAGTFLRVFLRRDRWLYLWWGLGAAALYYSQAASVKALYPTPAELDRVAASMAQNTAFVAMLGPARALDTIGGQVMWQASAFGAVLAGLMSMFLVGRHTRAEEESGRDELVQAAPVARRASFVAALLAALLANVVLGVLVTVSLFPFSLGLADDVATGVGLTLCGWVFTATALVAAQLTSSTRSMYGLVGTVLGVAYAARAIGDVGNPTFSWLSPIGWYQAMHPFSGLRWWPALLLLGGAAGLTLAAWMLFGRRDLGAGLWPARPGPERATPRQCSPLGLAWQLQRGAVLGWTVGLAFLGLAYGSIGNDVGSLIGDSRTSRELFDQEAASQVDGFYAVALVTLALTAAGFAIASALHPHGEEEAGRVEPLLATGLSRRRWLLAQVTTTVAGSLLVLVGAGLGLGAGFTLVTGDTGRIVPFLLGALGYVAPLLVLSGLCRLLYGLAPRWAYLSWLGLVLAVCIVFFGPLLRLPALVQRLSPYHYLALVPAETFRWTPFVGLLAVAASLSAAGLLAFTRRDVQ
jgi:ABC-2 type transport system permease protein